MCWVHRPRMVFPMCGEVFSKGVEVLKQGIIRRVGDGSNIKIWTDPWLPRDSSRRPITPRGHTVFQLVSDLIDPGTNQWDDTLIRDLFWTEDAKLILAMLFHDDIDDWWAWHYEQKGELTVRSAYKLQRDMRRLNSAVQMGEGSGGTPPINWKAIWQLPCPPKVHQFFFGELHTTALHIDGVSNKGASSWNLSVRFAYGRTKMGGTSSSNARWCVKYGEI